MYKIIGFMLIGATLITAGAFQWGSARKNDLKTYTALRDRPAGKITFDDYGVKFQWADHLNGELQRGTSTVLLQLRPRDEFIEVCGGLWVSKHTTAMEERALAFLRTAFITFRDIRLPADWLGVAIEGETVIADQAYEEMNLRCVLVNAKWQNRYREMDHRNSYAPRVVGQPVPPKQ